VPHRRKHPREQWCAGAAGLGSLGCHLKCTTPQSEPDSLSTLSLRLAAAATHALARTHTHARTRTHTHTRSLARTHAHRRVCRTHAQAHARIHTRTLACTQASVCACPRPRPRLPSCMQHFWSAGVLCCSSKYLVGQHPVPNFRLGERVDVIEQLGELEQLSEPHLQQRQRVCRVSVRVFPATTTGSADRLSAHRAAQ
jgi:hypothetical protein